MKKERKRLNKKIVALILVLSMVIGQSQGIFATESGNAAPAAPAVEAEQTPAPAAEAGQTDPGRTTEGQENGQAVEGQTQEGQTSEGGQSETPAQSETEEGKTEPAAPAQETPAQNEEAAKEQAVSQNEGTAATVSEEKVSDNSAEDAAKGLSADAAEEENAGASSENRISLSGGSISVNINVKGLRVDEKYVSGDIYWVSVNEILAVSFNKAKSLSADELYMDPPITKYTGEPIGLDFTVLSGNTTSSNILASGTDYDVEYWYCSLEDIAGKEDDKETINWQKRDATYRPADEGILEIRIIGKGDYENTIYLDLYFSNEPVSVSEGDVPIKPFGNGTYVTNKTTRTLFMYVVSGNLSVNKATKQERESLYEYGTRIAPGTTGTFVEYFDKNDKTYKMTQSTNYVLAVSTDSIFCPADAFNFDFRTTSYNGGVVDNKYEDGYSEIGMKAVVNKSTQTIQISWAPSAKKNAEYGKYKYFKLQRLDANGNFKDIEGWSGNLNKKSFKYKNKDVERAQGPAVFKLSCFAAKNDTTPLKEFVTVAAPSMLYVEQGDANYEVEYCFSKLFEDTNLSYRMEMADTKTEAGFEAGSKSTVNSSDLWEIKDFFIKKGLSVNALRDYLSANALTVGQTYYFRVKTEYKLLGKTYTSAPSNVLSRKAGPSKVYLFDVNGVKYQKPSGKNKDVIDSKNIQRMDEYLKAELKWEEGTVSNNIFIHGGNEGPDAKSGYLVFLAKTDELSSIKSFEILKANTQYGTYKKVKSFKVTNGTPAAYSGLYKWEIPAGKDYEWLSGLGGYSVYYAQYNKFVPETDQYFAVRGISTSKSAAGGFGDGYKVRPELDKVQYAYALDGTIDKINLYWSHDDCVKEYWIYKKEYAGSETGDTTQFTKIEDYTLIKKVKGTKSGVLKLGSTKASEQAILEAASENLIKNGDWTYNKFTDKDGAKCPGGSKSVVKEGKIYQYVIVPKYKTKNVTDPDHYNLDKRSDVTPGRATLTNAKIKNYTATNYGVGRVRLKWNKLKGAGAYAIIRSSAKPDDSSAWAKDAVFVEVDDDSPEAALRTFFEKNYFMDDGRYWIDANTGKAATGAAPVVGHYYYYTIMAGSFNSGTVSKATSKRQRSMPLAPTNVKVEKGGAGYKQGATVTWTKDSREQGNVTYEVWCRDMDNGSSSYGAWAKLGTGNGSFTDNNSILERGVIRQYRVVAKYGDYSNGRDGGTWSKPSKLEVSVKETTVNVGDTVNINVYPRRDGSPSSVADMGVEYSTSGSLGDVKSKVEGDHIVYTVKATGAGTHSITFKTYESGWQSKARSLSDLKQTVKITVRNSSPFPR